MGQLYPFQRYCRQDVKKVMRTEAKLLFFLFIGLCAPLLGDYALSVREKKIYLFFALFCLGLFGFVRVIQRRYDRIKQFYQRKIQFQYRHQGYPTISFYRNYLRRHQFICSIDGSYRLVKVDKVGKIQRWITMKGLKKKERNAL
ncbi:hypothetical protein [Listeria valentina]|uniref:hypothetical protein n=1 Tax=Listeria valentina TaxID=2705293 RepID=UPI00142FC65F|nr:hypothetical protein [Listeria valentina]